MKKPETHTVTLVAGGTLSAVRGELLLHALADAGVGLPSDCGGRGKCGKCKVRLVAPPPPTGLDLELLSESELAEGMRLACRVRVERDLVVDLPEPGGDHQKYMDAGCESGFEINPRFRSVAVPAPVLEPGSGRERAVVLAEALGLDPDAGSELDLVRDLSTPDWSRVFDRVVVDSGRGAAGLLAKGAAGPAGVALDLGTTSLAAALVDLDAGRVLARTTRLNPQSTYGADVVSRINYCIESGPDGLEKLRRATANAANRMIESMAAEAGVGLGDIYHIVVVGNTPMSHIFAGADPSSLGSAPYLGLFRGPAPTAATRLGLAAPRALVELIPNIFSFVGADTAAVILETGMDLDGGPRMAVDLGTNGEAAVAREGELWVTSTAAGCAFEGAQIVQGMRAGRGAISRFALGERGADITVIGGGAPRGICGSGLIDIVAGLLNAGFLDARGRFVESAPGLDRFLVRRGSERGFQVHGEPFIAVWERDIAELQLAKAAVRAGAELLAEAAGVGLGEIETLYVAGSFGNYLDRDNALRIGLLPPVEPDRIRFVGNAALTGAVRALLDSESMARARGIPGRARHFELGNRPGFQLRYITAMGFEA